MNEIESEGLIMEVKRTIKTYVKSFELGDVISFKLKDGEKVQAKAVKQTDEGMLFITVDCLNLFAIFQLEANNIAKLERIYISLNRSLYFHDFSPPIVCHSSGSI